MTPMTQHAASARCPRPCGAQCQGARCGAAWGRWGSCIPGSIFQGEGALGVSLEMRSHLALPIAPVLCPRWVHHRLHHIVYPTDPPSLPSCCVPNGSVIALTALCPQWAHLWVPNQPHTQTWVGKGSAQRSTEGLWLGAHRSVDLMVSVEGQLWWSCTSPMPPQCPCVHLGSAFPFRLWGHLSFPQLLSSGPICSVWGRAVWLQPPFPNAPIAVQIPFPPFPAPSPASDNNCLAAPNPSQVTSRQTTPRLNSAFLRAALTPPAPRGCAGVLPGVPSPALPFPAGPGAARCRLDQPFPALPVRG